MDAKKKLEGTYNPESNTRKERIVVGLSGGLDSLVSAYLLKIQKYDLFAVTIQPGWDQYQGDKNQILACNISDERLELIKEFCHNLKIPHHIIRASSEFQEVVVEEWMAAKVTASTSNACWNCHGLRMNLLYQKMLELDAKHFATGHYAKLFHHAAHDTYYVHTSNDEENDQSALLSRLNPKILSALMLPLSDLQKKEVKKLAENFGLDIKDGLVKMHECFPTNEKTVEYLEKRVPKSMATEGEIYSLDGSEMFGEHKGVLWYNHAEKVKIDIQQGRNLFVSKVSQKEKRLYLADEELFMHERIHLIECEYSEELSWVEPMKGVIKLPNENYVDCWIHPKSQNSAFVEWEGSHWVKTGEILSIMKKKGKNSKVYLTGKVRFLPKERKQDENLIEASESKDPQVDYSKDF